MFNSAGVIDEEDAPKVAVSEEAGGESEHSETEKKTSEASNNIGKEPDISFSGLEFFAFNLMYLGQYFSVEVTKTISVFGMVLIIPILWFVSTCFDHSISNRPLFV